MSELHVDQRVIVRWAATKKYELGRVADIYGPDTDANPGLEPRVVVKTDRGRTWAGLAPAVIDATVPDPAAFLVEDW